MSRSYKKFPVVKDKTGPGKKFAKRLASKAVRRYKDGIHNGSMYRKIFCSWNINDLWLHKTLREAIHYWEISDAPTVIAQSKQQVFNEWAKHYYRK
ncbi:hypothetical protein ABE137_00550 [Brevibacillus laterosporus]|uniref:Uncharacterized protein n=2 Tax=Brevibacillus TaxID=55080 RepID=A0A0F7C1E4_BRELA|nr:MULTISPECIES: hypothetical protein [Brevibacillus]AKF95845.1 hypothetical protein EX87_19795 [Brevibacillus laterosporus]MCR8984811.1 hypothetical protein [Brevibacillus laterosporus]MCZ0830538.1 hypothetical protein [Brevibacillus halotolerans]GIO01676.1 hypothetical protein J5TS2_23440 [Brevibacillus halotolerans]